MGGVKGTFQEVLSQRLRLFVTIWYIICGVFTFQVHDECTRTVVERLFAIPFLDLSSVDPLRLLLPREYVCSVLSSGLMACSVVCLTSRHAGIFRSSAAILAALQTMHFLDDCLFYQNHTYLMVLTSWSLCFVPTDAIEADWPWIASKARSKAKRRTPQQPKQQSRDVGLSLLLKGMFVITFLSGSLRKINPDWLSGHPLLEWIPMQLSVKFPALVPYSNWIALLLSIGGIVVDALIPILLLCSSTTAWFGLALLGLFMVSNGMIWEIDVFPAITFAFACLFIPGKTQDLRAWSMREFAPFLGALLCFLVVSSALPSALWFSAAQHYAQEEPEGPNIPSSVDTMWSECGMEFTWRMMLRFKDCEVFFFLLAPSTGRAFFVNIERLVTQDEYLSLAGTPSQLLHFSHLLAAGRFDSIFPEVPWEDVQVYALTSCSLNGRPRQRLLDPTIDLSSVPWAYCPRDIILAPEPFHRPFSELPLEVSQYNIEEARATRHRWKQQLFVESQAQFTQFAEERLGTVVPLTLLF